MERQLLGNIEDVRTEGFAGFSRGVSKKLRAFVLCNDIRDTAALVEVYNSLLTESERQEPREWIELYFKYISRHNDVPLKPEMVKEFAQLARIEPKSEQDKFLCLSVISTLRSMIPNDGMDPHGIVRGMVFVLANIDIRVFSGDMTELVSLAHDLFFRIKAKRNVFNRGSYGTHSDTLAAAWLTFILIAEIAAESSNSIHTQDVYRKFLNDLRQLERHAKAHYPAFFEAKMIRCCLQFYLKDPSLHFGFVEVLKGFACLAVGSFLLSSGVGRLMFVDFDPHSFEKGTEMCCAGLQFFFPENARALLLLELYEAAACAERWAEMISVFSDSVEKILEEQRDCCSSSGHKKFLRFGLVRQLHRVATVTTSTRLKETAIHSIQELVHVCAAREGWAVDEDVFDAMFQALVDLQARNEYLDIVQPALETLFSIPLHQDLRERWTQEINDRRGLSQKTQSRLGGGNDALFCRIKKEVQTIPSSEDVIEFTRELKKGFKVDNFKQGLFSGSVSRSLDDVNYNLVDYRGLKGSADKMSRIMLHDLFCHSDPHLSKPVRTVIVIGNPGCGKTMLSRKIASDWANGKSLFRFQIVYNIPLRELDEGSSSDSPFFAEKSLEAAIATVCFSRKSESDLKQLKAKIRDELDEESTLVMLDGLDECETVGTKLAMQAVQGGAGTRARLLLLSRPYNLDALRPAVDRCVECLGFTDEDLTELLTSELQADQLMQSLQSQTCLWDLAHNPAIAKVLLDMWRTNRDDFTKSAGSSLQQLHAGIVSGIWNRYLRQTYNISIEKEKGLKSLGHIAVEMLKENRHSITHSLLEHYFTTKQLRAFLLDSGFLVRETGGNDAFRFVHAALQEWFAGKWFARKLLSGKARALNSATRLIVETRYLPQFRRVFQNAADIICYEHDEEKFILLRSLLCQSPVETLGMNHLWLNLLLVEASLPYEDMSQTLRQEKCDVIKTTVSCVIELIDGFKWVHGMHGGLFDSLSTTPRVVETFGEVFDVLHTRSLDGTAEARMFSECLNRLVRKSGAVAQSRLEALVEELDGSSEQRLPDVIGSLTKVAIERPDTAENVLKLFVDRIEEANDKTDRRLILVSIAEVVRAKPSLAGSAFVVFKNTFESEYEVHDVRCTALDSLGTLATLVPSIAKDVFGVIYPSSNEETERDSAEGRPHSSKSVLNSRVAEVRLTAIRLMGTLAQTERELIDGIRDILVAAVDNEDDRVGAEAVRSLARAVVAKPSIAEDVVKVVVAALRKKSRSVQSATEEVVKSVIRSRPDLKLAVLDLLILPEAEQDDWLRRAAIELLASTVTLDFDTPDLVLNLAVDATGDHAPAVRRAAVEALGNIARAKPGTAEKVFEALQGSLKDPDASVRLTALRTMGSAVGQHSGVVPGVIDSLILSLKSGDRKVRATAVESLGSFIHSCPDLTQIVLDRLQLTVGRDDHDVRRAVIELLKTVSLARPNLGMNVLKDLATMFVAWGRSTRHDILQAIRAVTQKIPDASAQLLLNRDQRSEVPSSVVQEILEHLPLKILFEAEHIFQKENIARIVIGQLLHSPLTVSQTQIEDHLKLRVYGVTSDACFECVTQKELAMKFLSEVESVVNNEYSFLQCVSRLKEKS